MFPAVFAAALMVQLGGNVGFQVGLARVGLAVTVPVLFGVLIVLGAILGRIRLGEPIAPRSALAMGLLIVAVVVLSSGAKGASEAIAAGAGPVLWTAAAVAFLRPVCRARRTQTPGS